MITLIAVTSDGLNAICKGYCYNSDIHAQKTPQIISTHFKIIVCIEGIC